MVSNQQKALEFYTKKLGFAKQYGKKLSSSCFTYKNPCNLFQDFLENKEKLKEYSFAEYAKNQKWINGYVDRYGKNLNLFLPNKGVEIIYLLKVLDNISQN